MDIAVDTQFVSMPPWSVDAAEKCGAAPPIGDLLLASAMRWPDRIAVSDGESSYTYSELELGARAVAGWLADRGVRAGDRVIVLSEKRAVMPILAIAVWKCGAVYVPLDPSEPEARLQSLAGRLQPAALISMGNQDFGISANCHLKADDLSSLLAGPAVNHVTVAHKPDKAAYIIFASSSTGEPQGIEVAVASLLAYFHNHNLLLRFTSDSRVLSLSPLNVDVSLEDTMLPLSLGGYVFQFRNLPVGAVVRAVLARERITHLVAVSVLLSLITGDGRQLTQSKLPNLQTVMTGAEVCDPSVMRIWRQQMPHVRLLHAYGPPQATIFSLSSEITQIDDSLISTSVIGRPLPGVAVKIIKNGQELCFPGAEGELWIGGKQVMLGYFDRPDETARHVVSQDGVPFFRTGDICSYTDDGKILFHRHNDRGIVWLAGRRTHLNEVRIAALNVAGVEQVFVEIARRFNRDLMMLFVQAERWQVVTKVEKFLQKVLPSYMRPTIFVWWPVGMTPTLPEEGRSLFEQVKAAIVQSNSNYFKVQADGTVSPLEEV